MVQLTAFRTVDGDFEGIAALDEARHVQLPHGKRAAGGVGRGDPVAVQVDVGPEVEGVEAEDGDIPFPGPETGGEYPGLFEEGLVRRFVMVFQKKVRSEDTGLVQGARHRGGNRNLIGWTAVLTLKGPVGQEAALGQRRAADKKTHYCKKHDLFHNL